LLLGLGSQSFSRSVSKICFRPVKKPLTGLGINQWTLPKNYSSVLLWNVSPRETSKEMIQINVINISFMEN
jgi:hypothetical protein